MPPPQTSDIKILTSPIPPSQVPLFLKNKLHPLLPYTIPLYRRCQFFLHDLYNESPDQSSLSSEPGRPGEPEVWVAVAKPPSQTSPEVSETDDWLTPWLNEPHQPTSQTPWLASLIDIREPGQTQIWLSATWEAQTHQSPTPTQLQLGRALHHRIRTHHTPSLPVDPTAQFQSMLTGGKKMTTPYSRGRVTFGTIAESSWWILEDRVVLETPVDSPSSSSSSSSTELAMVRADKSYLKYLLPLPLPVSKPSEAVTPTDKEAFEAGELTTAHLQTMLDRSAIPRSLETLKALPSRGLFVPGSKDPVAWGIVTKDASVGSLHTEDGHRGRRLAERVVRDLVDAQGRVFADGERGGVNGVVVPWTHTDVSFENLPSRRVFEKMGAEVGWRVGWFEVLVGDGGS